MKRVLILTSVMQKGDKPTYLREAEFERMLNQRLESDVDVRIASLADLIYQTGTKTAITHPKYGDLTSFDAVVMRTVGRYLELAIATAHYLNYHHIPFSDSYLLTNGNGKLACAFIRALEGLCVPETFYGPTETLLETGLLVFPCVLKADLGHAGQDNFLVKDEMEYRKIRREYHSTLMVSQHFIPNEGDYRILIMNNRPVMALLRQRSGSGHLNNTSQGGVAHKIKLQTLSNQLLDDAITASRIERLQVAGVDMMIDSQSGQHYIIEVNRAPQIPSGTYISEKIDVYAQFIKELADYDVPINTELVTLGRVETILFADFPAPPLKARVDTGAKTSSIWARAQLKSDGRLEVTFMDESDVSRKVYFKTYEDVVVASSNGQSERRYKVKLTVMIKGRRIKAWFTLADRSKQVYPVLIGRNILHKKFIVDVSKGQPDLEAEYARTDELRKELEE